MKHKYILGVLLFLFVFTFVTPVRAKKTTFKPIEDAYINNFYANDNFGGSDYLGVGILILGYEVSYIKFNIPETNKKVISATIKTYWYNFLLTNRMKLCVGRTTNDWDENAITWNNAPYYYYDLIDTQFIGDMEWFNFDVLDYIPESGEFSIIIFEEEWTGEYLQSDSRECTLSPDPPCLIIKYEITAEDIIPIIVGSIVGVVIGVGAIIGLVIYLKRKKKRKETILNTNQNPYKVN